MVAGFLESFSVNAVHDTVFRQSMEVSDIFSPPFLATGQLKRVGGVG